AARCRSLFLWEDGSPMRFYVRPGASKLRLAPLVLAGGGRLCRVQEPGAVLLAEPGEAAPGGAVSTEYVTECVERNKRLPLEPFVLPAAPPPAAAAAAAPRGRLAFTEAEDAALLRAAEEAAQVTGLFAASNREFDSAESECDISDVSEELSIQDEAENSPGETASDSKTGLEDSAFLDTQLEREERPTSTCSSSVVAEVVKTMEHFMEKFGVDLFTVTQAFLKNSGEVEATSDFLQTGQRLDGYPIWSREDDLELQKDDEHVRNKLITKFGAENVAKRIAFRKS
ncbi:TE2IP protein, partial [Mionectes macconnelli]|nr:TE2IP protein [Mionectes macconnelli]